MDYQIIPMAPDAWPTVRRIYREGIATGDATFETEVPEWEEFDSSHLKNCRLVALEAHPVEIEEDEDDSGFLDTQTALIAVAWAALSPVSNRQVYRGVAEVSLYVAEAARGRGAGKALLKALVQKSERDGIWTLQAGVFPENTASIALHKSCGLRKVGVRRRIGKLGDRWRDVLLLERRSKVNGV